MQLPDFIKRMLGFVEKAEANQTAEKDLATARTRLTELEAQAKADQATIAERDAIILTLQGQVTAKDGEIVTLKASVATETNRANSTLAAQGLTAAQLPAAGATDNLGTAKESAWNQYCRLLEKDPQAACRFYAENAEAILSSRPRA